MAIKEMSAGVPNVVGTPSGSPMLIAGLRMLLTAVVPSGHPGLLVCRRIESARGVMVTGTLDPGDPKMAPTGKLTDAIISPLTDGISIVDG